AATAAYLRWLSSAVVQGLFDAHQHAAGAIAGLRAEIQAANGRADALAGELRAARAQAQNLEEEATTLRQQWHEDSLARQRDRDREIAALGRELVTTREARAAAHREITAMRATRGWRVLEAWWRIRRAVTRA